MELRVVYRAYGGHWRCIPLQPQSTSMLIRYGFRLRVIVPAPVPVVTRLDVHPSRRPTIVRDTGFKISGENAPPPSVDVHGNLCRLLKIPAGESAFETSGVLGDSGAYEPRLSTEVACLIEELPEECLLYLLPSRYCESDLLGSLAWGLFGHLPRDAALVRAVVDYVHDRLKFGYAFARPTRTALEAHEERVGVCRDFAHLTIAFCRALNIPARYVNGYLGDIGVPEDPAPMDFSAWVEVFVGGRWFTQDARHNQPRIGRIVIARGRDATDVPMIHSFGPHALTDFAVVTEELQQVDQLAA